MTVKIKRVYDEASAADGCRVLVDRLWPRGVKKEQARLDAWAKEAAPSTELRKWFHAHPDAFDINNNLRVAGNGRRNVLHVGGAGRGDDEGAHRQ